MEPVLKTGGQRCLVGSNPTPSAMDTRLRLISVHDAGMLAAADEARLHLIDQDIQTVAEVLNCEAAPQGWLVRCRLLTLRPLKRSGLFYSDQA